MKDDKSVYFVHRIPDDLYGDYEEAERLAEKCKNDPNSPELPKDIESLLNRMSLKFRQARENKG